MSRIIRFTVIAIAVACFALWHAESASALDWSPEEIVGGDDEEDDWGPQLGTTPDGRAWAVWMGIDPVGGDGEIYYSVHDGLGWSTRSLVHEENNNSDRFPTISVGDDGVPWVAWQRYVGGQYKLLVSQWGDPGWREAVVVREECGRYDHRSILSVNSTDVWVATDAYVDTLPQRIILAYHWDGADWAGPWTIGFEPSRDLYPDLGVDSEGRAWIVWLAAAQGPNAEDAVACSIFEGGAWASPAIINDEPGNLYSPRVAFDEDGTPLVVWAGNSHEGQGNDVEYSTLVAGEWTPAGLVSEPDGYYDEDAGVACDAGADGAIWAVWVSGTLPDLFTLDIVAARWLGDGWSSEEVVSDPVWGKEDRHPDVAVAIDGSVWAAWMRYVDVPPYDFDIAASHGTETTAVDFCCLEAQEDDGRVRVTWYGAMEGGSDTFCVWKHQSSPDGPADPAHPPDGATRVQGDIVADPPRFALVDEEVAPGTDYTYWVEWVDPSGSVFLGPAQVLLSPSVGHGPARLLFTRPNPSRDGCCIGYEVLTEGRIELEIRDVAGRGIARLSAGRRRPGRYDEVGILLCWHGRNNAGEKVASGVYFARLLFDGRHVGSQATKITVVR